MRSRIVVVGQVARDLVLQVEEMPDAGGNSPVVERLERMGGKGANHALGLRQLGADVALVGVVGVDDAGRQVLDDAERSGLDITHVVRRGRTALLVDVVDSHGSRLLEDIPPSALLTETDVNSAAEAFRSADTACLQLQQPPRALIAAARLARYYGACIVLDGAVDGDGRETLLGMADVVRADAAEATMLTGVEIEHPDDAVRAAERIMTTGPSVVAFGVAGLGDLVAWPGGSRFFPFTDDPVIDVTGAGDAFLAGLVTGLRLGTSAEAAGELAAAAATATVGRLGGRPDLSALSSGFAPDTRAQASRG